MTDLLLMALGPLGLIHVTYYFAVKKNDLSVIDTTWGLGFIALSLIGNILSQFSNPREILILVMVLLWGLRLSLFIHSRNKGKPEDYRYTQMRNNWGENANRTAYFKVYLLQFGLMLVVGLPIFAIHFSGPSEFLFLDYFGFGLWLVGLLWEAVSDYQKSEFKKTHKHEICDVGLWFYSRHPNYFGEIIYSAATAGEFLDQFLSISSSSRSQEFHSLRRDTIRILTTRPIRMEPRHSYLTF